MAPFPWVENRPLQKKTLDALLEDFSLAEGSTRTQKEESYGEMVVRKVGDTASNPHLTDKRVTIYDYGNLDGLHSPKSFTTR